MTMKMKRSNTAAKVPLVADLADGQLAVNTNDAILYLRKTVGVDQSVVRVGAEMSATVAATLKEATLPAFREAIGAHDPVIEKKAATGSGVAFTGIPAWVSEIDLMFLNAQFSTSAQISVQLRNSSGTVVGTYIGGTGLLPNNASPFISQGTTAFVVYASNAGFGAIGLMSIRKGDPDGTIWAENHLIRMNNANESLGAGYAYGITAAEVAQVYVSVSAGTFSAGELAVRYR